jgi:glutathione S-transferase
MPRCQGFKPNNSPCERIVGASQSYCYSHDPNRAQERHRAASKAARSKPNRELADVKDRLRAMIDDVRCGRMARGDASVCAQLYNSLLRALSLELKIREVEELAREVEEIRAALEARKESRWGYGSS